METSFPDWTTQTVLSCLHGGDVPSLWSSLLQCSGPPPTGSCLSMLRIQSWMQHSRWSPTRVELQGRTSSLICWPWCFWCSSGCVWRSGLQMHSAGSGPTSHSQTAWSPSLPGCSQSHYLPSCVETRLPPSHSQDLVEPNSIHMVLLLQLVQLPLDDILSLRFFNHSTQLGAVHRLAEGVLSPAVCVIDEDIKQYWTYLHHGNSHIFLNICSI